MTDITITIDEAAIRQHAEKTIADNLVSTYSSEYRDTRVGIRKVVEQAVKDLVYSHKDEIIEKCIARASAELVRKGIGKLMEGMK